MTSITYDSNDAIVIGEPVTFNNTLVQKKQYFYLKKSGYTVVSTLRRFRESFAKTLQHVPGTNANVCISVLTILTKRG